MNKLFFFTYLFSICVNVLFSQTDSLLENGVVKQKEGKNELAKNIFSELIGKHQPEVNAYVKKWNEYQKLSKFERAEKSVEIPLIDSSYARLFYLRGISSVAIKSNSEAMDDFSTAIKINSKYSQAYYERAKLLWFLGKKYESCCDLRSACNLGDTLAKEMFDEKFCWNESLGFYKEALTKLNLNQYETSLDLIQKSIRIAPDSTYNYMVRGNCYFGLGKLDSALSDFDKVIAEKPSNLEAYFGRGLAYYANKKYQEAFEDFNTVIRINNRYADAYLYRAYSCEGLNKVKSALFDYTQVQRLKPKDALAFYKSGLLKNENSDAKGACIDFKRAAELGSTEAADYVKTCK
jgi:tetratricopeptide (TPR) repeat protein